MYPSPCLSLLSCTNSVPTSLQLKGKACVFQSLLRIDWHGRKAFGLSSKARVRFVDLTVVRSEHRPSTFGFGEKSKTTSSSMAASREHSHDIVDKFKNKRKTQTAPKVAFFDVDGTITRTNVVFAYFTHRITELSFVVKLLWLPWFAMTCIFYVIVDSINRAVFNRIFYLSYKGRSVQCKSEMADFIYANYYRPRIFTGAEELIQKLKQDGFRIVFVTGCLDFLIAPLAHDLGADFVYAAELVEENGRFTGKLKGMAASNTEKADRVKEYARVHGILLSDSLAFGDSVADIPMLEVVGYPHVVNPDARLQAVAEKRGWPIIRWALKQRTVSAIAV